MTRCFQDKLDGKSKWKETLAKAPPVAKPEPIRNEGEAAGELWHNVSTVQERRNRTGRRGSLDPNDLVSMKPGETILQASSRRKDGADEDSHFGRRASSQPRRRSIFGENEETSRSRGKRVTTSGDANSAPQDMASVRSVSSVRSGDAFARLASESNGRRSARGSAEPDARPGPRSEVRGGEDHDEHRSGQRRGSIDAPSLPPEVGDGDRGMFPRESWSADDMLIEEELNRQEKMI